MRKNKYATIGNLLDITKMTTEDVEIVIHHQGKDHHFKIRPEDIKIIPSNKVYFPNGEHEDDEPKNIYK